MSIAMKSTLALQQKSALACKVQRQSAIKPVARTRTVTKALSDVNVVVGGEGVARGVSGIEIPVTGDSALTWEGAGNQTPTLAPSCLPAGATFAALALGR